MTTLYRPIRRDKWGNLYGPAHNSAIGACLWILRQNDMRGWDWEPVLSQPHLILA